MTQIKKLYIGLTLENNMTESEIRHYAAVKALEIESTATTFKLQHMLALLPDSFAGRLEWKRAFIEQTDKLSNLASQLRSM